MMRFETFYSKFGIELLESSRSSQKLPLEYMFSDGDRIFKRFQTKDITINDLIRVWGISPKQLKAYFQTKPKQTANSNVKESVVFGGSYEDEEQTLNQQPIDKTKPTIPNPKEGELKGVEKQAQRQTANRPEPNRNVGNIVEAFVTTHNFNTLEDAISVKGVNEAMYIVYSRKPSDIKVMTQFTSKDEHYDPIPNTCVAFVINMSEAQTLNGNEVVTGDDIFLQKNGVGVGVYGFIPIGVIEDKNGIQLPVPEQKTYGIMASKYANMLLYKSAIELSKANYVKYGQAFEWRGNIHSVGRNEIASDINATYDKDLTSEEPSTDDNHEEPSTDDNPGIENVPQPDDEDYNEKDDPYSLYYDPEYNKDWADPKKRKKLEKEKEIAKRVWHDKIYGRRGGVSPDREEEPQQDEEASKENDTVEDDDDELEVYRLSHEALKVATKATNEACVDFVGFNPKLKVSFYDEEDDTIFIKTPLKFDGEIEKDHLDVVKRYNMPIDDLYNSKDILALQFFDGGEEEPSLKDILAFSLDISLLQVDDLMDGSDYDKILDRVVKDLKRLMHDINDGVI